MTLIQLKLIERLAATPSTVGLSLASVFAFTTAHLCIFLLLNEWQTGASDVVSTVVPVCADIPLRPLDEQEDTMPPMIVSPGEKFTFNCLDPDTFLKCIPAYDQFRYWKLNGKLLIDSDRCRPNNSDSGVNVYLYRNGYDVPERYYQLAGTARTPSAQGPVECAYKWSKDTFYVWRSYLTVVSEDLHMVAIATRRLELRCTDDDRLIDGHGNNLTAVDTVKWYWSENLPSFVKSDEYQLVLSHRHMGERAVSSSHSRWSDRRDVYVIPRSPLILTVASVMHADAGTYKCEAMTRLLGGTSYGVRRVSVWNLPLYCPKDEQ